MAAVGAAIAAAVGEAQPEPEWLALYRARAEGKEVAEAWHRGLDDEARQEAEKDAPLARFKLRRLIVDSQCPEVRADATDGWKYTGSVLRAADLVLGISLPVSRRGPEGAAASGSGAPAVSRNVAPGTGTPGSLGLWWSDFGAASSAEQLRAQGVTRRLNVAAEAVGKLPQNDGIPTTDVAMLDVFDEDRAPNMISTWVSQLGEAMDLLRAWREEGAVVNVSCQMGKNRSGAVCLAWLVAECGWKLDAGADHLRTITALALGNPHLAKAVADLVGSDDVVPLNPAGDGGGWVCISPPGTPRQGGTQAFDDQALQALQMLAREAKGGTDKAAPASPGFGSGGAAPGGEVEEEEEGGCDVAPLFGEDDLSDVD